MHAIIATGGKQYKVMEGSVISVESIKGKVGSNVNFDNILMFFNEDIVKIGHPKLENVIVKGHITDQFKNKKILVFKYKKRKRYRRKYGHRQLYTAIKIDRIKIV